MSGKLERALEGALSMLDRSRRRTGGQITESTKGKFDRLERELKDAREALNSGRQEALRPLTEIVRWTADWIPDPNDPLLKALDEVQLHARTELR